LPVVGRGVKGASMDLEPSLVCPACLDLLKEPYVAPCRHTFCRECLQRTVQASKRCPQCYLALSSMDDAKPNHEVNAQVLKYKKALDVLDTAKRPANRQLDLKVIDFIEAGADLNVGDLDRLISSLQKKRNEIVWTEERNKLYLSKKVLVEFQKQTKIEYDKVVLKVDTINNDLKELDSFISKLDENPTSPADVSSDVSESFENKPEKVKVDPENPMVSSDPVQNGLNSAGDLENFNSAAACGVKKKNLSGKTRTLFKHLPELSQSYFVPRSAVPQADTPDFGTTALNKTLDTFCESVSKVSQFSGLRMLATIDHAGEVKYPVSTYIASSIEFDKDSEYFAVAGLTKKIRIFEYANVVKDAVDIHYPVCEMSCISKISCVCWNPYLKNKMASSDYEGDITIWDAFTAQKQIVYREHQKRCWSIDFNKIDTKLLASVSDDSFVKLWHMDSQKSVASMDIKSNVCCVQFNPENQYCVAFGSADHCVHYYDLRNMKECLKLFRGHNKAVSYVKFISGGELVSASTDSQLKIWDLSDSTKCVQSLKGHLNEKNFVGLATDGEYVACGSENNSVYVYYKGLQHKLFKYRFDQRRFAIDPDLKEEETADFVSSVCWRKGSNVLLAGNSNGVVKVLQLV